MKKKLCIAIVCGILAVATVATGIAFGNSQSVDSHDKNPSSESADIELHPNGTAEETEYREAITIPIPETTDREEEAKLGFDVTLIQPDRNPQIVGGSSESDTKEVENGK